MLYVLCSMTQMAKILAIGSVTKDTFLPTAEGVIIETPEDLLSQRKIAFELGAKYHIADKCETLGGCSINVAIGMVKLGLEAQCYAPVGEDETGKWIKAQLQREKIGIKNLVIIAGHSSDASSIVVDKNSGERVIFSGHDASEKLEIAGEQIDDCSLIFIGDLSGDWQKNLETIIATAKAKKIPIAFNPREKAIQEDSRKIMEASSVCDFLFVNKDEALEILSSVGEPISENETALIREFQKIGVRTVVLTDGVRGAWVGEKNEILHAEAILQPATVDTTGAGDAFVSGFLSAYLKEKDLATALKWGIANSSSSITQYGGQAGLLNRNQIELIAKNIVVQLID
jgi:ribokinase